MMSLRFYTFSSNPRTYISVLLAGTAVLLFVVATISSWGYQTGRVAFDFYELYVFQRTKVNAAPSIDTIFVGDSSLGNAIDARLWSLRTGEPTLNLALTGAFGYGGSLNMIRHVLAQHRPRRIVIMQTPDMLTRGISYQGYLHTTDRLFPLDVVPLSVIVEAYLNLDTALAVMKKIHFQTAFLNLDLAHDYVRQSALPLSKRPSFVRRYRLLHFDPKAINPSSLFFLRQIASLCRSEKLDCVYAHGPILDSYCTNSADYLQAANTLIKTTGLGVVTGTPVCMPLEDSGDSEDHVSPGRRTDYTEKYLVRIENFTATDRR